MGPPRCPGVGHSGNLLRFVYCTASCIALDSSFNEKNQISKHWQETLQAIKYANASDHWTTCRMRIHGRMREDGIRPQSCKSPLIVHIPTHYTRPCFKKAVAMMCVCQVCLPHFTPPRPQITAKCALAQLVWTPQLMYPVRPNRLPPLPSLCGGAKSGSCSHRPNFSSTDDSYMPCARTTHPHAPRRAQQRRKRCTQRQRRVEEARRGT